MYLTRDRSLARGKWSKSLRNAKEIGQFWLKFDKIGENGENWRVQNPQCKKNVPFWPAHPGPSLQGPPPLPRPKERQNWRKWEKIGQNWPKLEETVNIRDCKIPSVQKTTPFGRPTQAFHRFYQMTKLAVATVGFRVLGSS